ncbi:unnamed protein product, partial [Allacma fusca]
ISVLRIDRMGIKCSSCSFQTQTLKNYWKHLSRKHRSDGNLKLRCKLHNTQFDTLQRFKDHCKIVHKLQVHEFDKVLHIDRANDGIDSEDYINTTTKETLLFTLELESRFQLGQVGVQFVIENMASIIKTAKEKNEELEIKKIASEHKRKSIFVIARRNGIYVSDPCDDIRTIYLAISIDEIEIVNPIGTNTKKHKITIGCVEILNLLPQFRSALQAKHLLFVAKTMHLKTDHGLFAILGDFVRTLNSGADGIPLGPSKQQFRLKFMYATADSPANAFLYGFKEAVGPALKFCRTCEISRQNISQGFNDQNYTMRTLDSHLRSLSQIEQADSLRRSEIQKATGIVRRSPLLDIHDFSLRSGIHDVMHVLLEGGVLACCTQWFLNYLIKGKARLTMDQLNQIALTWNYCDYDVRNKPRKLDERIINPKTKINMTAMSLYVFAQELLFMLHPFLQPEDEPHVLNFSRILHITQFFLFSKTYTDEALHTLRLLIAHFMHVYVELYPEAKVNPKHHFLTHLILMILEFGPTCHLSCLRFEAKYELFKLRKWKNFLNVPFSQRNVHKLPPKVVAVEKTLSVGSHTLNRNSVLEISNPTEDIPEFCKLYGVLRKGDELYAMVDIYLEAVFIPEVCAYQVSGSEPAIIPLPEAEELLQCPHRIIHNDMFITRQDLILHNKPPVDISMESTETTQINGEGLHNDNSETPQNLLIENGCTPPKDQSNPAGPNHLCTNESFLFAMQESVLIPEADRITETLEMFVPTEVSTNLKEILRDTTEVNQNRSTEESTSLECLSSQQLSPLIRQASLASNFETSVDVHLESFNHLSTATFTESDVNVSALRQKYSKQDPNAVLEVADSQLHRSAGSVHRYPTLCPSAFLQFQRAIHCKPACSISTRITVMDKISESHQVTSCFRNDCLYVIFVLMSEEKILFENSSRHYLSSPNCLRPAVPPKPEKDKPSPVSSSSGTSILNKPDDLPRLKKPAFPPKPRPPSINSALPKRPCSVLAKDEATKSEPALVARIDEFDNISDLSLSPQSQVTSPAAKPPLRPPPRKSSTLSSVSPLDLNWNSNLQNEFKPNPTRTALALTGSNNRPVIFPRPITLASEFKVPLRLPTETQQFRGEAIFSWAVFPMTNGDLRNDPDTNGCNSKTHSIERTSALFSSMSSGGSYLLTPTEPTETDISRSSMRTVTPEVPENLPNQFDEILNVLTPSQRKSFFVTREILTSERTFVDVLNLLTKDFPASVQTSSETHANYREIGHLHFKIIGKTCFNKGSSPVPQSFRLLTWIASDYMGPLIHRLNWRSKVVLVP